MTATKLHRSIQLMKSLALQVERAQSNEQQQKKKMRRKYVPTHTRTTTENQV